MIAGKSLGIWRRKTYLRKVVALTEAFLNESRTRGFGSGSELLARSRVLAPPRGVQIKFSIPASAPATAGPPWGCGLAHPL
jgi:hypothetical protein